MISPLDWDSYFLKLMSFLLTFHIICLKDEEQGEALFVLFILYDNE